ncbi:MAG: hypothetical protein ACI87M_000318 [Yoonia sp.]
MEKIGSFTSIQNGIFAHLKTKQVQNILKFALLFGLICFAAGVSAQGTIKGFIKDSSSGEPVAFVNVYLEGTSYGIQTDVTGYYSLTQVNPGSYKLVVASIEYKKSSIDITIENGKVYSRNFQVDPSVIQLDGAEIRADQGEQETEVRTAVQTIRPSDLKRVPSFGGQADIVQVLQVLPGFVSTGDQGGQLYIRGGSPVQNKVLLDGMIIYNAFHSIGLFSVFDADIIANADVYSGGFSGEFGGRVSSVMDITTRDGNKKKVSGKIGASPFGGKIMVEGPLKKLQPNGSGISYILSAKRSYLEESSKLFYSYIDEEGLPFNFTDLYGKVSFSGGSGSKVSLYGFSFNDDVRYQSLSDLSWSNVGGGANFLVVPSGSAVLISGNFAISNYEVTLKEDDIDRERRSSINGFNFGLDFKYILGDDDIKYGLEVVGLTTDFVTFNSLGVEVSQKQNTTELGFYTAYKKSAGKWLINPSIRIQYYASAGATRLEPRMGLKYKMTRRFRLKASAGLYSQNLISANSDRDVVNLFYGFLTGPENLQDEIVLPNGETKEIKNALQLSKHLVAGFEFDLTDKININLEGYVKDFDQLTGINRNKLFEDSPDNADVPDVLKKDFIVETGIARGADVVIKYEERYSSIWLVYGIADVDRWDGFRWYDPVFDRRHNINFVASHAFGKKHDWEASLRWNLGSGLPFTQTQGYYQVPGLDGDISSDYVTSNSNELGISYAGLNEGRLPYYHRLDVNVRRTLDLGDQRTLEFNLGATNLYSRANVFYVDRVTGNRVDQLPFLPSLGVDFRF